MGQGSQSGMEGQHPAWSQLAQMGGSQLPDPVQRAREHFFSVRDNFAPVRQEFMSMQPGPEKAMARPEFAQEREQFQQVRNWLQDLQNMPEGEARGLAAFGPPRVWGGPQTTPLMEVPQIPGINHDGTVRGLLSVLQRQTANRQRSLSPPPVAQENAGQSSPWRPAHELGIPFSRDPHPGSTVGGGNPVAPGSLFYRPKHEGDE